MDFEISAQDAGVYMKMNSVFLTMRAERPMQML